jgi:hypothetical protein
MRIDALDAIGEALHGSLSPHDTSSNFLEDEVDLLPHVPKEGGDHVRVSVEVSSSVWRDRPSLVGLCLYVPSPPHTITDTDIPSRLFHKIYTLFAMEIIGMLLPLYPVDGVEGREVSSMIRREIL